MSTKFHGVFGIEYKTIAGKYKKYFLLDLLFFSDINSENFVENLQDINQLDWGRKV